MAKSNFHRLLEAKIEKAIQDTAMDAVTSPCTDISAYRDLTGYVRGLMDALKLASDIEGELNQ